MNITTRKPTVYTVYVIELSAEVLDRRAFAVANPGWSNDAARPPLYVGHTVRTPEERFEQHRTGTKSGRFTRGNALRLRMDLAPGLVFATREEAELMERQHAEHLRAQGFAVWQK